MFNYCKHLNRKFGFPIAILIVFFMFFISHYWFFKFLPLTYASIDTFQYLSLQKLWNMGMPIKVGYPSYGYILFLYLISFLHNSLFAVSLVQSLLCFLSLILLLYAIYQYIDKTFIIWTAIALGAFVAAPATVFFNTSGYPDALLSSLYILFSASVIFMLKSKRSILWTIITAFIITFSIFVRASSLFFLPLSIAIIVFLLIIKLKKNAVVFAVSLSVFLLIIVSHNYLNPLYKSYGIIERSIDAVRPYFYEEYYALSTDIELDEQNKNDANKIISSMIDIMPTDNLLYKTKNANLWKETYRARNSTLRGVVFKYNEDNNLQVFKHDKSYLFTVDSVITDNNMLNYTQLSDSLLDIIKHSEFLYKTIEHNLYWKTVLFRKFYAFFYDKTATELSPLQYGNIRWRFDVYNELDKINATSIYTRIYAKYHNNPELVDVLMQHSLKEFYKMYEKNTFDFDNHYYAMQANLFFKIYDVYMLKIHNKIFQSPMLVIIFAITLIASLFFMLFRNIKSKNVFIILAICAILVALSVIHSIHYVSFRYAYSSMFVYFVMLGIFPFCLQQAYLIIKKMNDKHKNLKKY
jgi:hypothetical protein